MKCQAQYIKNLCKRILRFITNGKFPPESVISKLRKKGVIIGENVDILESHIDSGHGRLISIGDNVTITGARILSHDASTKKFLGYSKIGFVKIGNNVFIGNGAIVLPGTTIGNDVIIGAGSIIASDIPDNSVVIGNPAKILCTFDEYISRNNNRLHGPSGELHISIIEFAMEFTIFSNSSVFVVL